MAKIMKRTVAALQPEPDRDVFKWDAELRGFGLRVNPSGVNCLAGFRFSKNCSPTAPIRDRFFAEAAGKILPHLEIEIVKRSDQARGFVKLPKRWIIERSIAWLNRCRRLAKDWENLNLSALMFLRFAKRLIRGAERKIFLIVCTRRRRETSLTPSPS